MKLFTKETVDDVDEYKATEEAEELFINFISQDHISNALSIRGLQREAFMAGLLEMWLKNEELEEALVRLRDTTSCTQAQYQIIDEALTEE